MNRRDRMVPLLSLRPKAHIAVCDEPGEHGERRHILIKRRRVELVHRIISGVMQIKIVAAVLMQPERRHPARSAVHVGSAPRLVAAARRDPDGRQQPGDVGKSVACLSLTRGSHFPHPATAKILSEPITC